MGARRRVSGLYSVTALTIASAVAACSTDTPSLRPRNNLAGIQTADDWFAALRSYPKGIPAGAQFKAFRDAAALEAPAIKPNGSTPRRANMLSVSNTWFPLGPTPLLWPASPGWTVSGRGTVIVANPANPQETWLGTATGGVWHTNNAQSTDDQWLPINGLQFPDFLSGPNVTNAMAMSIGSLAVDGCTATGCNTVWIGTGEDAARRDTFYGAGLFQQTAPGPIDPLAQVADFRYGSVVAIALAPHIKSGSPLQSTTLYVGVAGGETSPGTEETQDAPEPTAGFGVFQSTNGGGNFNKLALLPSAVADKSYPTDIQFDPADTTDQTLLVAVTARDRFDATAPRGIFRTKDGGATWCSQNDNTMFGITKCPAASGLPAGNSVTTNQSDSGPDEVFGWTSLQFSAAVANRVYALVGQCGHRTDGTCPPAVYRSDNNGKTWNAVTLTGPTTTYGRYTHPLAIVPGGSTSAEQLVIGGLSMYECPGLGGTCTALPGDPQVHSDHHAFVFPDPAQPGIAYDADDGGFVWNANALSSSGSWVPGNGSITSNQFDSVAVLGQNVLGGLQDNMLGFFNGTRVWHTAYGGDGGQVVAYMSGSQATWIYTSQRDLGVKKSIGDPTANQTALPLNATLSTQLTSGQAAFFPPLALNRTNNAVYLATTQVWESTDDGGSWNAISPTLATPQGTPFSDIETDNVITALAVGDDGTVYAGTYIGEVWVSASPCQASSCWTKIAGPGTSSSVPNLTVSSLVVKPGQSMTAYVALSGFGTTNHVWTTTSGGAFGWQPASTGLVDSPADVIRFDPAGNLWLGTDIGIYELVGGTWTRSQTLPFMPIMDIAGTQDAMGAQRLYAATHGRGMWVLTQPTVTTLEGWTMGSIWDLPVYAYGFNNTTGSPVSCLVSILQKSGNVCARDTIDVNPNTGVGGLGGSIQAEPLGQSADGQVDTTQSGMWDGKPVVWACNQGTCMRKCDTNGANCSAQVPIANCNVDSMGNPDPVSTIEVNCGAAGTGFGLIEGAPTLANPPAGSLSFTDPAPKLGHPLPPPTPNATWTFEVAVSLKTAMGAQVLCRSPVTVPQGSSTETMVLAAVAAINANPSCTGAGLTAVENPSPISSANDEDVFSSTPGVSVQAPGITGSELFVTFRAAPGSASAVCFDLSGLGDPIRRQAAVMETMIETGAGGAAGGSVRFLELSDVGACSRDVVTTPGMTASQIASAIGQAFDSIRPPGPAECIARANPDDIQVSGSILFTALTRRLRICSFDPGIGFSTAPDPLILPNHAPVCSAVTAVPTLIWPPDQKFDAITLSGATDPDGDPVTYTVTEVKQDENPDGQVDATLQNGTLLLRAQRDGSGDGRVYHVSYTVSDPSGASCSGQFTVCVPHDQGMLACFDQGALYSSGIP